MPQSHLDRICNVPNIYMSFSLSRGSVALLLYQETSITVALRAPTLSHELRVAYIAVVSNTLHAKPCSVIRSF